ncbi:hypothetical protein BAUCODRAFT_281920 [Baudoinia panamericana UAMH 10762]|uniref:Uncharacterized protein n=1 Tax=Baudoinia panamericana (strain UAMH 10762) TaxID=717646 RepID=M2M7C0_BAUPA|nr:uncharacterized protein BAUCODRAFT_281920 [Baudoinia panamericana UAMH 10762]EMC92211.1 hypothetical protein BAUCODRAFT_281920 [Baudoinia panamericana UAMH 10762]
MPHHHLLRCGHTIMTRTVGVCGRNCQQSVIVDGREHCFNAPFACREPSCMARRCGSFPGLSIPNNRRHVERPRPSQPGHVYGHDAVADAKQQAVKQSDTLASLGDFGLEDSSRMSVLNLGESCAVAVGR